MKVFAYRKQDSKILIFLLLLTVLAARSFLNPFGLFESDQVSKAIFYGLSMISFLYAYTQKGALSGYTSFPNKAYYMILIGISLTIFTASFFQNQSFQLSLIAALPYFFGYIFLYTLLKLKIRERTIVQIIAGILCISTFAYIMNYIMFPVSIFDTKGYESEVDDTRGVIRIGVPYIPLFVFGLFYTMAII